jgi:diadenosine tetraphosphate (Ap4A) HIT family hydrolase
MMMRYDNENVFEKILRGETPAFRVYESAHALALMGIMIAQLNGAAAGQTVFHMHFHILPRFSGLEFKLHAREMEDSAVMEAHARRIRACLFGKLLAQLV